MALLLVDDHEMVLDTMTMALTASPSTRVCATARTIEDARTALETHRISVVVTDLRLPDGLGTELVDVACAFDPPIPVVLISGTIDTVGVQQALTSGCAGFVSKSAGFDQLLEAVTAVARGGVWFPAGLMTKMLRSEPAGQGASLTPRELEVLQLLAEINTVDEIAARLVLSIHTVRNHVKHVLAKLEARSQLEAIVIAHRRGLIEIP